MAAHNVKLHRTATKKLHHPVVGELELTGEALELPGDPGLTIITYTVEPASPSEEAMLALNDGAHITDTRVVSRRPRAHREAAGRQDPALLPSLPTLSDVFRPGTQAMPHEGSTT